MPEETHRYTMRDEVLMICGRCGAQLHHCSRFGLIFDEEVEKEANISKGQKARCYFVLPVERAGIEK